MDNNVIAQFNNLDDKLCEKQISMQELYDMYETVKSFATLQQEIILLEEEKRTIEPHYYAQVMSECEHVFAESSYKEYEWEKKNGRGTDYNKYNLIVNHYCLKCGCATIRFSPYDLERYGIIDTPTGKVPYMEQIKIIEAASDFSIIDCNGISTLKIIELWRQIKEENPDLTFEKQLVNFQNEIQLISTDKKRSVRKLVLRKPTIYEHRHLPKNKIK